MLRLRLNPCFPLGCFYIMKELISVVIYIQNYSLLTQTNLRDTL